MRYSSEVGSDGVTQFPKEVLEALRLGQGGTVFYEIGDYGKVTIRATESIMTLFGILQVSPGLEDTSIAEARRKAAELWLRERRPEGNSDKNREA